MEARHHNNQIEVEGRGCNYWNLELLTLVINFTFVDRIILLSFNNFLKPMLLALINYFWTGAEYSSIYN
jgi:hypothetical protein